MHTSFARSCSRARSFRFVSFFRCLFLLCFPCAWKDVCACMRYRFRYDFKRASAYLHLVITERQKQGFTEETWYTRTRYESVSSGFKRRSAHRYVRRCFKSTKRKQEDENVIRRACENASSRLRNLRSRGQSIRKESKCWIKKIDRTWKNKYMKYGQYNWEKLNTSKQKKILWINALCYDCSVRL